MRLVTAISNDELRASMIGCCIVPALKLMSPALEKKKNPYGKLMTFVKQVFEKISIESLHNVAKADKVRMEYV
jgi:nitrate reductase assembly molybdenum cofactor insertion protein NarJ